MAVNTFTDLTFEEFTQQYLGLVTFSSEPSDISPELATVGRLPTGTAPSSVSREEEERCKTPVTNQNLCNSCAAQGGMDSCIELEPRV